MNNNHEKEPKPLFDDCSNCDERYFLTEENCVLNRFIKQPDCNYIFCICPHCMCQTRIFVGEDTTERYIALGLVYVEEEYADEATYETWLDLMEIKLIKPRELTQRQEKMIGFWAYLLANDRFDVFNDDII